MRTRKILIAFLAAAMIFLAHPASDVGVKLPHKPPATIRKLLPHRKPDMTCPSGVRGAWAAAYLNHPQIGYLTVAYYYSRQLIIVGQIDIAQDQPLFTEFNQAHEPLIEALYELGARTSFSQACENVGTLALEVKK